MSMMTMMMITAHSKTMKSSNMNATQHDETTEGRNHMSKRKEGCKDMANPFNLPIQGMSSMQVFGLMLGSR